MRRIFMIIILINLWWLLVASQYEINDEPMTEGVSYEDIQFRVVNGKQAKLGEFPYQISFKKGRKRYYSFCGGSLIGSNKILTAGHCFTHQKNICEKACGIHHIRDLQKIRAVAGTLRTVSYYKNDPSSPEQWRALKSAAVPKGYDFPKRDICVVFTVLPFKLNEYVGIWPVASRQMDYGSMDCVVSGYGRISDRIISDSLLWAPIRLIPRAMCSYIHGKNMRDFICTSSHVTNVLQGDSGGGMVCKNINDGNDKGQGVIVGVVSGAIVSRRSSKTFFTRVTSYRKFIQNRATSNSQLLYIVWLSPIISRFI